MKILYNLIKFRRSKALQIGALQSAKNRFKSLKSAPIWSALERRNLIKLVAELEVQKLLALIFSAI